jgi:hypothetical protein
MEQPQTGSRVIVRPTDRPPEGPIRRGYLEVGHRNRPLEPLTEAITGCHAYGNGEKTFYVHAGPKMDGYITLKVIEAVDRERSPYLLLCRLKVDQGNIRIEDMQNVYPGSEPDLGGVRMVPLQEWRGLGFFHIVLEHTKRLAMEGGIRRITIDPDNTDLREHYAKFGFMQDPEREYRMQLTF